MVRKFLVVGILASFSISMAAQAQSEDKVRKQSGRSESLGNPKDKPKTAPPKTEGGIKPAKPPKTKEESLRQAIEELRGKEIKDAFQTCDLDGKSSRFFLDPKKAAPKKSSVRPSKNDIESIMVITDAILYENLPKGPLDPDAGCACVIGGDSDKKEFLAAVAQELIQEINQDRNLRNSFPEVDEQTVKLLIEMGPFAWREKFRKSTPQRQKLVNQMPDFGSEAPLLEDGATGGTSRRESKKPSNF